MSISLQKALFAAVLVAACVAPQSAPAPPVPPTAEENLVLQRLNEARRRGHFCGTAGYFASVQPLRWNPLLALAARKHSEDLARNDGAKGHVGSDGSRVAGRIEREGYRWIEAGEIIAWGENFTMGPEEAVVSWLNSPAHCRTLMNPAFTEAGVGRAGGHWTAAFATPRPEDSRQRRGRYRLTGAQAANSETP